MKGDDPLSDNPSSSRKRLFRWVLYLGVTTVFLLGAYNMDLYLKDAAQTRRLMEVEVRDHPRPDDVLRQVLTAVKNYASDQEGHLPPTLRSMIPKYLSEENLSNFRYLAPETNESLDWLYLYREKLDGLPDNTILFASPVALSVTSGVKLRIVTTQAGDTHRIPEADFQRLIREQNPPPAPSSPPAP